MYALMYFLEHILGCYFIGGRILAPQNLQETVSCFLAEGTI